MAKELQGQRAFVGQADVVQQYNGESLVREFQRTAGLGVL